MARKVTYDQDKVKELRMEVILASLAVIKGEDDASSWSQYKRELVSKYAARVLPVLNAGRDDDKDLPNALLVRFLDAGKDNGHTEGV